MRVIDAGALEAVMMAKALNGKYRTLKPWVMAIDAIHDAPTIEPMQWIPCSERLPKNEKRCYWVCTDTECQCECRWTNNIYGLGDSDNWGWSIFDTPQYTKVVAWMPLPEPYKGW